MSAIVHVFVSDSKEATHVPYSFQRYWRPRNHHRDALRVTNGTASQTLGIETLTAPAESELVVARRLVRMRDCPHGAVSQRWRGSAAFDCS